MAVLDRGPWVVRWAEIDVIRLERRLCRPGVADDPARVVLQQVPSPKSAESGRAVLGADDRLVDVVP